MKRAAIRASTFFGLMAEFGTSQIPLADCCESYFGCGEAQAKEKAAANRLPVPAFKVGSQKAQWFIHAEDLARHIDAERERQAERWQAVNGGAA